MHWLFLAIFVLAYVTIKQNQVGWDGKIRMLEPAGSLWKWLQNSVAGQKFTHAQISAALKKSQQPFL